MHEHMVCVDKYGYILIFILSFIRRGRNQRSSDRKTIGFLFITRQSFAILNGLVYFQKQAKNREKFKFDTLSPAVCEPSRKSST